MVRPGTYAAEGPGRTICTVLKVCNVVFITTFRVCGSATMPSQAGDRVFERSAANNDASSNPEGHLLQTTPTTTILASVAFLPAQSARTATLGNQPQGRLKTCCIVRKARQRQTSHADKIEEAVPPLSSFGLLGFPAANGDCRACARRAWLGQTAAGTKPAGGVTT